VSALAPTTVMAGLVPAIHALSGAHRVRVDTRDKPGHDGREGAPSRVVFNALAEKGAEGHRCENARPRAEFVLRQHSTLLPRRDFAVPFHCRAQH
jgi:hypothetical protein